MKVVLIIYSGFSSLFAACYMQKAGYIVTVVAKNKQFDKRASILKEDGFRSEMEPS